MTEERDFSNRPAEDAPGEEVFERLFEHASPRLRPPEKDERFVRDALFAEWDELMGRRQRRRRGTGWAIAASVLIVVGSVAFTLAPNLMQSPPRIAAQVERVLGAPELMDREESWHALTAATGDLYADQVLKTSTGARVAMRLASGGALRLDQNSELRLSGDGEVELTRGALYFDSRNDGGSPGKITVVTELGFIRNVGTVFTARISDSRLDIRVREGKVQTGGPHELSARADRHERTGQRIELSSSGPPRVTDIPIHGEEWKWVERIAPSFDLEGRKVVEFLDWVARETGFGIQYATSEVEQPAREEEFFGLVVEGEPLESLAIALETVDLQHELREKEGVIFVRAY